MLYLFRGPLCYNPSAFCACAWSHINDVVCPVDCFFIMFNNDNCIAGILYIRKTFQELYAIF